MIAMEPLSFLLKNKKNIIFAEIGVHKGMSTKYILENFDIKKYYAIDPFKIYDGYKGGYLKVHGEDNTFQTFLENIKEYQEKIIIIRELSSVAIKKIPKNSLDFCFIDGNHNYSFVLNDLKLYLPKVKKNGILCGHDTNLSDVKHAINKFFNIYGDNSVSIGNKFDVFIGKKHWFMIKQFGDIYW